MKRIKKLYIDFRIGLSLLHYKIFKRPFPLMTHLLITNRCNLRCTYCYPQVTNRVIEDMPLNTWKEIIDNCVKMGTRIFVLLGGEPLIRDDIGEIIDYAKSKNTIVEIVTNGFFVKDKINQIKNIDSLCISIDGPEELNDSMRGKGSFQKAMEAVKVSQEAGITARLHSVVTKATKDHIEFMCNVSKDLDAPITFTQAAVHTDDPMVALTDEELLGVLDTIENKIREGFPVAQTLQSIKEIKERVRNKERLKITKCFRKMLTTYIDANGNMYPCTNLWHKIENPISATDITKAWEKQLEINCPYCDILSEAEMNATLDLKLHSIIHVIKYRIFKR